MGIHGHRDPDRVLDAFAGTSNCVWDARSDWWSWRIPVAAEKTGAKPRKSVANQRTMPNLLADGVLPRKSVAKTAQIRR